MTDNNDPDLRELFQSKNELFTMSETRLYPDSTPTEMVFRIETDHELIGEIRYKNIRWFNRKAELSLIVAEKHQRGGYGKEALGALLNYAFNKMNLHRLEAEALEYNTASIMLLEKFGFVLEGTLREAKYSNGKYWNIFRYGLLKSEYKNIGG